MDAIKYFKEAVRMCESSGSCINCLFNQEMDEHPFFPCKSLVSCKERIAVEKCVSIVEKWSAEHPAKTRQSEFLNMFPNAPLRENGSIAICPLDVDRDAKCSQKQGVRCPDCQKEYWITEVGDE